MQGGRQVNKWLELFLYLTPTMGLIYLILKNSERLAKKRRKEGKSVCEGGW